MPIENPDDLLEEALRRLSPEQQEHLLSKAADEALRLAAKEQEAHVDSESGASQLDSVVNAAQRFGNTGARFEIRAEHRSQHGSTQIKVHSRPRSLRAATGFGPRVTRLPPTLIAVVVFGVLAMSALLYWTANHDTLRPTDAVPSALTSSPAPSRVLRVVDGDTLVIPSTGTFGGEEKVRLLAIDTPERGQPWFNEASAALESMVVGHSARVEFETPNRPERDKYGRLLGYVFAGDVNVNVEIVRQGWSPYLSKYGEGRFAKEMVRAEEEARAAHRGIWASR